MIIECPVCKTKYDIKAQVPPEGRTVRCAKCGNIWRAKATDEHAGPKPAPVEGTPPAGHREKSASAAVASAAVKDAVAQKNDSWGAIPEATGAAPSDENGGDSASSASALENDEPVNANLGEKGAQIRAELAAAVSQMQEAGIDIDESGGKVRWYGGFLKKNSAKPGHGDDDKQEVMKGPAADPIQFPRLRSSEPQKPAMNGDLKTLEEAREAVRGVFASLEPKASSESAFPAAEQPSKEQEPVKRVIYDFDGGNLFDTETPARPRSIAADHTHDLSLVKRSAIDPESFGLRQEPAFEPWDVPGPALDDTAADGARDEPAAESHPWLKTWKQNAETAEGDEGDPDAQLRNSLRANFEDRSRPVENGGAGEADAAADTVQRSVLERLASWRRPPAAPITAVGKAPEADASGDAGELAEGDVPLDRRLVREIEETRDHAKDRPGRAAKGGLAIAAAWGLFLCVAAGLLGGLLGFRDIAADAVPGLGGLYKELGMPVTVQPLIFESVQYEWMVQDYKPVILITGAVYNRGHRNVKVPDFVITIKDDDPALDREYSANLNLNVSEIRPDQRGEFQIELQSPSPSIAAVELELRNVR